MSLIIRLAKTTGKRAALSISASLTTAFPESELRSLVNRKSAAYKVNFQKVSASRPILFGESTWPICPRVPRLSRILASTFF